MAIYNMSFLDNSTNILQLATGIGGAVGNNNLVGYMILVSFFMVFLILSVRFDFNEILIIDGFLTTILAILLFIAEMIPAYTMIYPALVMVLALLFYLIANK